MSLDNSGIFLISMSPPISQQRPRFFMKNGKSLVCDPQSTLKRKLQFDFANQMRLKGFKTHQEGAICVKMAFHMPMAKSWSKKRVSVSLGKYVTSTPDCDNMCKFYLDVLNTIAYHDDSQVAVLMCKKVYSEIPRVEIQITSLQENILTLEEKNLTLEEKNLTLEEKNLTLEEKTG